MWGLSKSEKLEKRRRHTLSFIRDQRWRLDAMIERAQVAHDPTNPAQVEHTSDSSIPARRAMAFAISRKSNFG